MPTTPDQSPSSPDLPRVNPQWTWMYAGAIGLYAVICAIGVLFFGWDTSFDIAVPALAIACWMSYVYVRHRDIRTHLGLLITALGWLAVAIAFLLRGSGARLHFLRVVFALLGFVAILWGGLRAYAETRGDALSPRAVDAPTGAAAEEAPESVAPPDATPGGTV